ncbi:amidohydrolase family protein [Ferrovibrio sp.]|uniref:amidohydrolase family protein n=1 Tax=Ferrovibrio sp. TaxID=1917215 RepID=UPI0035B49693
MIRAGSLLVAVTLFGLGLLPARDGKAADLPLIDAHVHYSHDAWQMVPTADAIAILRRAGLRKVLVSSSSDDGTQKLYEAAPDLIVPELRPYRSRGELSSWMRDDTVLQHIEARLAKYSYVGIGEFHVYGADADLPVLKRVVALAKQHKLFLHAHSDADAVERLFRHDPQALVLWAHSGFDRPDAVRAMLKRYPTLWADLAFRSDHASQGKVDPAWRVLFEEFPDRFMVGTDTFTPERWFYIEEHAKWSRGWLADLPAPLAERIAYRNAEALFARTGFKPTR